MILLLGFHYGCSQLGYFYYLNVCYLDDFTTILLLILGWVTTWMFTTWLILLLGRFYYLDDFTTWMFLPWCLLPGWFLLLWCLLLSCFYYLDVYYFDVFTTWMFLLGWLLPGCFHLKSVVAWMFFTTWIIFITWMLLVHGSLPLGCFYYWRC